MKKLNLRPHHGLCVLLFSEEEHSEPYIAAMNKIITELDENPQTEIVLQPSLDIICGSCRHNLNSWCEKSDEVNISDDKILECCGLEYQTVLPWSEFRQKLIENIISKDLLRNVCAGCMYVDYCEVCQKC